jgi:Fic family protein
MYDFITSQTAYVILKLSLATIYAKIGAIIDIGKRYPRQENVEFSSSKLLAGSSKSIEGITPIRPDMQL